MSLRAACRVADTVRRRSFFKEAKKLSTGALSKHAARAGRASRGEEAVRTQPGVVAVGKILRPQLGVMDQPRRGPAPVQRHVQRGQRSSVRR